MDTSTDVAISPAKDKLQHFINTQILDCLSTLDPAYASYGTDIATHGQLRWFANDPSVREFWWKGKLAITFKITLDEFSQLSIDAHHHHLD